MKLLLILLALWPGTMVAQSCGKEETAVKTAKSTLKTAEDKLKVCKNKPDPEVEYNRLWTEAVKRHKKERRELTQRHYEEHQSIIKKTGYDPNQNK